VAGVDQSVEQGLSDDRVGEQRGRVPLAATGSLRMIQSHLSQAARLGKEEIRRQVDGGHL
jgi:hypothetical protein